MKIKPPEILHTEKLLYDFIEKLSIDLVKIPYGELKRKIIDLIIRMNEALDIIDKHFS